MAINNRPTEVSNSHENINEITEVPSGEPTALEEAKVASKKDWGEFEMNNDLIGESALKSAQLNSRDVLEKKMIVQKN